MPAKAWMSGVQAPLAPMSWGAQVGWQFVQLAALTILLWLAWRYIPFGHGFGGIWVLVSPLIAIVKLVIVGVLTLALAFFGLMAVFTEVNTVQRTLTRPVEGLTLPTVKVIGQYVPGRQTWVLTGGVQPTAQVAYLRSKQGEVLPGSAMSSLVGRVNIVTFDTPRYGLDETTAFPYLMRRLEELNSGQTGGGLVFVGLSNGTASDYRLVMLYGASGQTPAGRITGLVLLYPTRGAQDVKEPSRLLMRVFYPYSGNPFLEQLCKWNWFANLITPEDPAARKVAEAAPGGAAWFSAMRADNKRFAGNYLANVNLLARSHAFDGPPTVTAYPVYVLALADDADGFLHSGQATAAVRRQFPQAQVVPLTQGGHGQTAEFGPYYAELFAQLKARIDAA